MVVGDAVKSGEGAGAAEGGLGVGGVGRFPSRDHDVFGGVFGAHELDDFCLVSGGFEEDGAEGVSHEFGVALLENAVAEGGGEDRWGSELGAQLFLATGGDDQEAGAGFDAGREGVVGRGVAGVEGDKKVERAGIHIMDMAGGEF